MLLGFDPDIVGINEPDAGILIESVHDIECLLANERALRTEFEYNITGLTVGADGVILHAQVPHILETNYLKPVVKPWIRCTLVQN